MHVENLYLQNFRNIKNAELAFHNKINIICGENGQGKTSILEALYLLAIPKSFRSSSDKVLLQHEEDYFDIKGSFTRKNEEKIEIRLYYSPIEGKHVFYNGNKLTRFSEIIGTVPVILLSLEDLELSYGLPGKRRRFLDILLSQISPIYLQSLQAYKKSLQHRNRLLSLISDNKESVQSLFPWNLQLTKYGLKLTELRYDFVEYLNSKINEYYTEISQKDENVQLFYRSTIDRYFSNIDKNEREQKYLEILTNKVEDDLRRNSTTMGPHRDDLSFKINDYHLKSYGSQGENKTFLISLKLAESDYIKEKSGKEPILLMDDIFGELDDYRIGYLLDYLSVKGQTFITTTHKNKFEAANKKEFNYLKVDGGKILQ